MTEPEEETEDCEPCLTCNDPTVCRNAGAPGHSLCHTCGCALVDIGGEA